MSDDSLEAVLLNAFAVESTELLARLAAHVVQFDRGTAHPRDLLQQMSIDLHTLTGAASTAGLETVSLLCKVLEDFVDELAHGNRPLNRLAIESLRRAFRLLSDACAGGPAVDLMSVLQSLRLTPGWQPRGLHLDAVVHSPTPFSVTDSVDLVATASSASPGRESHRAGLDAHARAVHFQFTALHAAWKELRHELSTPDGARLAGFATQFDAAMDSLDRLTREIIRTNVEGLPNADALESSDIEKDVADPHEHKTILVVDDSRTARTWVRGILESAGYTVYVATNGLEALELLPSLVQLDLLVTDLKMPRMDGATLCKKVRGRAEFARMPIVILTSQAEDSTIEAGLMAGADMYVVKQDLVETQFLQTVDRLLH